MSIGDWILVGIAIVGTIPAAILFLETIVAILPRRQRKIDPLASRSACVVLIPAHNEELGIGATVAAILPQLKVDDRILVVADNCADETARVARENGAGVLERQNALQRGKGFALEFGMQSLEAAPPQVVVILDADARVAEGALDQLVADAAKYQRPIQAVYIENPVNAGSRERWSAFAMLFKNWVRPLGLYRLGFPCLLTGSGMAFPWEVLRKVTLGTANIVEDMKLGLDLAIAGKAPRLCPEALVTADSAPHLKAVRQQRTRWEHGHVKTLLAETPRLLLRGMLGRPKLLGLAAELSVPPLSLLAILLVFFASISLLSWSLGGSFLPFLIFSIAVALTIVTILLAWCRFGQQILPLHHLLLLPVYVLWKIPIYLKLLVSPQKTWNRTERTELR
jgi:cellulose synthase/poly-beta-1,6-N-acetylglucosamine synthase-like glycosyltransferase